MTNALKRTRRSAFLYIFQFTFRGEGKGGERERGRKGRERRWKERGSEREGRGEQIRIPDIWPAKISCLFPPIQQASSRTGMPFSSCILYLSRNSGLPVRSRKMKKTLESMKVIDERIVVPEGQGGEGERKDCHTIGSCTSTCKNLAHTCQRTHARTHTHTHTHTLTEHNHIKEALPRCPVDHGPETRPQGLRGTPELLKVPVW